MKARQILLALVLPWMMTECTSTGQGPLSLAIVEDQVVCRDATSHFNVAVTNVSKTPLRIWEDRNSWGYYGLSFEIVDETCRMQKVTKHQASWTGNYASAQIVPPRETLVLKVCPLAPRVWKGFPTPGKSPVVVSMQAVLEFKPDKESEKLQVWTGRTVSQVKKFTFSPP